MLILRIQVCFFLTYRALKVAGNYRPERRKMGFDLRTFGAMLGGIYHKKCCLQSVHHSEQALLLSIQMCSLRVCDS